jgi:hypothetical protein
VRQKDAKILRIILGRALFTQILLQPGVNFQIPVAAVFNFEDPVVLVEPHDEPAWECAGRCGTLQFSNMFIERVVEVASHFRDLGARRFRGSFRPVYCFLFCDLDLRLSP